MPIYEFRCGSCGHVFEKIAKPDEEVVCKICKHSAEKTWSRPAPMVWGRGGRGF